MLFGHQFAHDTSLCILGGLGAACSVQESVLLSREGGQIALEPAVIAVIDERPLGGASLNGGTTGGGTYADASNAGTLYVVRTVEDLRARVSGDASAIVLIAEGTYAFSGPASIISGCTQACNPTTPLASQTIIATYCTNGETLFDSVADFDTLRIGKNKTVIGLGKGAVLSNVELDLSDSSNIILRNLTLANVTPNISGKGTALELWPSDHVWIDHCTIRNMGRSYVHIISSWDEEANQALVTEAGYITLTHNHFDGRVDGICGQRNGRVIGTSRNPALTLAYNWFDRTSHYNPFLFGPGTWAHLFNNHWSDIDRTGVASECGAAGLLQGNVFESTIAAIYNGDDDGSSWKFCSAGVYGKFYAPMGSNTDEDNLLDANSTVTLHEQTTDGTGLTVPARTSGHDFTLTAPVATGSRMESYRVTLVADPSTVPNLVKATAGVGHLF